MAPNKPDHSFRAVFSLDPLLNFWRKQVVPSCSHMSEMFSFFEQRLAETPELHGDVEDLKVLEKYHDLLIPLMSVVFPAASWETDIAGALTPFTSRAIYVSPRFKDLLVADDGTLRGRLKDDHGASEGNRLLRAYFLILDKVYGIRQEIDTPIIRIVPDKKTSLDCYYGIVPDLRFVEVRSIGEPRKLTEEDRSTIIHNLADPDVLANYISPDQFEFRGFSVINAVDITETEIISSLERDLIDQESIFSQDGFRRVQERLRVLFGRTDLLAGMGALSGDHVLLINDGCQSSMNCIFANSQHIPLKEIQGTRWFQAVVKGETLRIPDLQAEPNLTQMEQHAIATGTRSMIISPLFYQRDPIGTFVIKSPRPNDLGPMEEMLIRQIAPIFSVALKRGLDEMNHEIQAIIKEKCTAVHPSVEWRFRKAAMKHMDRSRMGQPSEMEPIVFQSVVPLYGQSDIRGSSDARNKAIQADLIEQLTSAMEIMKWAGDARNWPLIKEFEYRIDKRIHGVNAGLDSSDEASVAHFLSTEMEPIFDDLMGLGPRVVRAIEKYRNALDPNLGVVYRKRREFEDSVSKLNETLSAYLDKEETETQAAFPHYFEKHQTDGIDYIIYVGASMMEDGKLSTLHMQNLALWQIMVACGMARHTEHIKAELRVPLDTCHLILVNHTPLSIRFRYDEKRFDVDGAYDVRNEIIKSRIDKAVIKGTNERLTQPGRVAIVYSNPAESKETLRHIEFLQSQGFLLDDLEHLNLDDLPGVRGLRALRVGVNLEAEAAGQLGERMYG